ncbi:MAG TPA: NINE protein [Oxalicibacterium sp.]|uniref:NINE protein n=1 Tax=Oxalicibacterium sp. TaxID=2766525 RepID=UPI002C9DEA2A|nr:NINE protein [Oxalicibacterium sp.]HWU98949.1 NINE protein [Oxalicibacterium sp.]
MSTEINTNASTSAGTPPKHKNKMLATLLSALFGGVGAHRFYLHGSRDFWGWNYVVAFLLFVCALFLLRTQQSLILIFIALFPLSIYAGLIEALVIGLTPDDKWDAKYNARSGSTTTSKWPIAVILVLSFALGFTALIAGIARATDLYLTGGAFG